MVDAIRSGVRGAKSPGKAGGLGGREAPNEGDGRGGPSRGMVKVGLIP